jgi:hypothetical protein
VATSTAPYKGPERNQLRALLLPRPIFPLSYRNPSRSDVDHGRRSEHSRASPLPPLRPPYSTSSSCKRNQPRLDRSAAVELVFSDDGSERFRRNRPRQATPSSASCSR